MPRFRGRLLEEDVLEEEELAVLEAEVEREVAAAIEFGRRSDYPPAQATYEDMYADRIVVGGRI